MKKIILVLLILGVLGQVELTQGLWPRQNFGEFQQGDKIVTYYDFNRDRFIDILALSSSTNSLKIYIWNEKDNKYSKFGTHSISSAEVDSVIAADLNKDEKIDIILMKKIKQNETAQTVNLISIESVECQKTQCIFQSLQIQWPIIGSLTTSIITIKNNPHLVFKSEGSINLLSFSNQADYKIQKFDIDVENQMISKIQQIFVLDYNGDCVQDLVFSTPQHILFLQGKDESFNKKPQIISTDGLINYLTFSDIDYDGLIDLILFLQIQNQYYLQTHYNTFTIDIDSAQICLPFSEQLPYHFKIQQIEKVFKIQRNPITFLKYAENKEVILRLNDIDNDGYPELIIDAGFNQTYLLQNQKCTDDQTCGTFNPNFTKRWDLLNIRKFRNINHKIKYNSVKNGQICAMSFNDLKQDGKMDLMINFCDSQDHIGKVVPVLNTYHLDAFFMKVSMFSNYQESIVKENIHKKINFNGGHVSFFVTTLNGQRRPVTSNQLMQNGKSLQLPYCFIGLGRTNNYVQKLKVTLPLESEKKQSEWTPIVPNSQLIVVPNGKWLLKTYISPTQKMTMVFWGTVLVLSIIGGFVIYLTNKEKQEDKQNQESFYSILR